MRNAILSMLAAVLATAWVPSVAAQQAPAPAQAPAEVQQLVDLLRKPAVQEWLAKGAPSAGADAAAPSPAPTESLADELKAEEANLARDFRRWVAGIRAHVAEVRDAAVRLPVEMATIGQRLATEVKAKGFWQILLFAVGLLVLGYGCQQAYWSGTRAWRKHVLGIPLDTVGNRLKVVGQRLAYNLLWLLSFAVGSLGALLLFSWPPYLKGVLTGLFLIVIIALLWRALARFILSPSNAKLRVFPISDASARHWSRWDVVLLGWFFGGFIAMQVLQDFDVDRPERLPLAYALGLILFVLAMVALWRRPALSDPDPARRDRAFNVTVAVSVLFAAFWLLWVFGLTTAFWVLLVAVGLPTAVSVVDRSVDHILTPPGTEDEVRGPPSVIAAALERGARALLIIGAIWLLSWVFGVDLDSLTAGETMTTRVIRGVLNAIIILLVADFAWHVIRTLIDKHLHASAAVETTSDGSHRGQPARAHAHVAADPAQHPVHRVRGHGDSHGAVGHGRADRAADRRCRRGRRGRRFRRADAGQGRDLGDLLPARRRVPRGRVHHQRQLQGHGGELLAALDQAAPPSRLSLHRAVRLAGCGAEHEPRLGDRQSHPGADLRHRPRQGEEDHQAGRQGAAGRPRAGAQHHPDAQDAGRGRVWATSRSRSASR